MINVALFGGAYNPCHLGHVEIAQFILDTRKEFDEVWLMPTYHHMYNKDVVAPEHRLEMCRIGAKEDPRIKVFDYEIRNKLWGETYYTIEKLVNDEEYKNYKFSFIIGIDNANTFEKWFEYEKLQSLIQFVILPRSGYQIIGGSWYTKEPHIILYNYNDTLKVSSTKIRNLFQLYYYDTELNLEEDYFGFADANKLVKSSIEEEILKLLHKDVCHYIVKNNLYQNENKI